MYSPVIWGLPVPRLYRPTSPIQYTYLKSTIFSHIMIIAIQGSKDNLVIAITRIAQNSKMCKILFNVLLTSYAYLVLDHI